jgi:hypothetical protein
VSEFSFWLLASGWCVLGIWYLVFGTWYLVIRPGNSLAPTANANYQSPTPKYLHPQSTMPESENLKPAAAF